MSTYRLLEGFTVLDLSRTLPGPFCTWLLAGLGARVIVVEEPRPRGTPRSSSALGPARDRILYSGKERLAANLKREEGRALFFRLLERADVAVEDFRPGVAARLGVDYAAVSGARPEIVYCSISAFGQDGPYRDRPAHDINCLALAGVLDLTGSAGGPPVPPASQVADLAAGSAAAVAILAALLGRTHSGLGQYLDVAMLDATIAWMVIPLAFHLAGQPPRRGQWTLGGSEPFYRAYRCKDGGYFSVGNLEPWLWKNLLDKLGVEEPTNERLEAIFATRTREEWREALADVDSCVAPVNSLAEALEDPQLRHRGMLADELLGLPFRLSVPESRTREPGRPRGADTDAMLGELGYSATEIERLRVEGVV